MNAVFQKYREVTWNFRRFHNSVIHPPYTSVEPTPSATLGGGSRRKRRHEPSRSIEWKSPDFKPFDSHSGAPRAAKPRISTFSALSRSAVKAPAWIPFDESDTSGMPSPFRFYVAAHFPLGGTRHADR
jgi:hypothetical protein